MNQVIAYLRTSTDKQDLNNQRLEILDYARLHGLTIVDFITISMSSRHTPHERRIDELMERLLPGDTLLVTELSRLGRSTGQVITLIDRFVQLGIRIVVIKHNLILDRSQDDLQSLTLITLLSLFTEMERIMELLHLGVSARHISTHHLQYGSISGLNSYIKTRHLR